MSNGSVELASGGRRTHPRSQRKPAGGGEGCSLPNEIPSPAVSEDPFPMRTYLAQLDQQRKENGGWLVPRPPEEVWRSAGLIDKATLSGSMVKEPNAAFRQIIKWLNDMFEAGCNEKELVAVRYAWQPYQIGIAIRHLRDHCLDDLERQAGNRDYQRRLRREEEELPGRQLGGLRLQLREHRREREKLEEQLLEQRAKEDRTKAAIETLLQQHPHLNQPLTEAA